MEGDHVVASHSRSKEADSGSVKLHDAHATFRVSHDQNGLVGIYGVEPARPQDKESFFAGRYEVY